MQKERLENQRQLQQQLQKNNLNIATNPQAVPSSGSAISPSVAQATANARPSPSVAQNATMASSPSVEGVNTQPLQITSVPMVTTTSNQAARSPVRPLSAARPHANGVGMARQASQNQIPSSTVGTPQMQSTPQLGNVGPARLMTPQPRQISGSPIPGQLQSTPMMMSTSNGPQQLTPEQQHRFSLLRAQNIQRTQSGMGGQVMRSGIQGMVGMSQLSPQQISLLQQQQQQRNQMASPLQQGIMQQQHQQIHQQTNAGGMNVTLPNGAVGDLRTRNQQMQNYLTNARKTIHDNVTILSRIPGGENVARNLFSKVRDMDRNMTNARQMRQSQLQAQFPGGVPAEMAAPFQESELAHMQELVKFYHQVMMELKGYKQRMDMQKQQQTQQLAQQQAQQQAQQHAQQAQQQQSHGHQQPQQVQQGQMVMNQQSMAGMMQAAAAAASGNPMAGNALQQQYARQVQHQKMIMEQNRLQQAQARNINLMSQMQGMQNMHGLQGIQGMQGMQGVPMGRWPDGPDGSNGSNGSNGQMGQMAKWAKWGRCRWVK